MKGLRKGMKNDRRLEKGRRHQKYKKNSPKKINNNASNISRRLSETPRMMMTL